MDLDLASDQELMRETAARFIQSACPLAAPRELTEDHREPRACRDQAAQLGWYATESCQGCFDDVELSDEDTIGEVNRGWSVARRMLVFERGAGGSPILARSSGRRELASTTSTTGSRPSQAGPTRCNATASVWGCSVCRASRSFDTDRPFSEVVRNARDWTGKARRGHSLSLT